MNEVFYSDTFNNVPTFLKVLIILGFITMVIIMILLTVCIWFLFQKNKDEDEEEEMNIDNYKEFLEEFKSKHKKENINEDKGVIYPTMPKIKDLNGEYLKDLIEITIV